MLPLLIIPSIMIIKTITMLMLMVMEKQTKLKRRLVLDIRSGKV